MTLKTAPGTRSFDIPGLVVMVSIAVLATCLAWPQIFPGPDQTDQINLPSLDKRAAVLRQISDPIQRDRMGLGLSYYGRQLDAVLPPHARIYMTGMLGPTNVGGLGYYFFFRNYLFPRDLEISLGNATFGDNGFIGVGSDSPDVLRSNGFDVLLGFPNNQFELIPLTTNGIPLAPKEGSSQ
jgi:hypothetical protein